MFSDEACFHLDGCVNKQNCRYYTKNNPQIIHKQPLHLPKLHVWWGVVERGVVGPYFFTATVNTTRYIEMLEQFFIPTLKWKRKCGRTIFQQDSSKAHTSDASLALLCKVFHSRLISNHANFKWPPRSPDLTCCDYFLWGFLNLHVYCNKPRTLAALKQNISEEIVKIPRKMLKDVYSNFVKRLKNCLEHDGQQLSDIVFKQ